MTHGDAKRRLKRWFISGLHDGHWEAARKRTEHLQLGGVRLILYADGVEGWADIAEDDLNALMRAGAGA